MEGRKAFRETKRKETKNKPPSPLPVGLDPPPIPLMNILPFCYTICARKSLTSSDLQRLMENAYVMQLPTLLHKISHRRNTFGELNY